MISLSLLLVWIGAVQATPMPVANNPPSLAHNDFSCRSSSHMNPVVLLHGLGATYYEDLNALEAWLKLQDFCTFSITYGAYDGFPLVGGLKPIAESSEQVAAFIEEVKTKTAASKIDLVGHSEGGFLVLYTPKFGGVANIVDRIVAIAPPTHGTTFANLIDIAYLAGNGSRELVGEAVDAVGCSACNDLLGDGSAVMKMNDGEPIVQSGNQATIITSRFDELVTPTTTAFVTEDSVNNIYIQDYCPLDIAGHIGEAYDTNVWNLVLNSLEDRIGRRFFCLAGPPGK